MIHYNQSTKKILHILSFVKKIKNPSSISISFLLCTVHSFLVSVGVVTTFPDSIFVGNQLPNIQNRPNFPHPYTINWIGFYIFPILSQSIWLQENNVDEVWLKDLSKLFHYSS